MPAERKVPRRGRLRGADGRVRLFTIQDEIEERQAVVEPPTLVKHISLQLLKFDDRD